MLMYKALISGDIILLYCLWVIGIYYFLVTTACGLVSCCCKLLVSDIYYWLITDNIDSFQ